MIRIRKYQANIDAGYAGDMVCHTFWSIWTSQTTIQLQNGKKEINTTLQLNL